MFCDVTMTLWSLGIFDLERGGSSRSIISCPTMLKSSAAIDYLDVPLMQVEQPLKFKLPCAKHAKDQLPAADAHELSTVTSVRHCTSFALRHITCSLCLQGNLD